MIVFAPGKWQPSTDVAEINVTDELGSQTSNVAQLGSASRFSGFDRRRFDNDVTLALTAVAGGDDRGAVVVLQNFCL